MTTLTNELVYLARMEEAEDSLPKMELSISDIVQKTVNSFQALAQIQKKELVSDIEPMLFLMFLSGFTVWTAHEIRKQEDTFITTNISFQSDTILL